MKTLTHISVGDGDWAAYYVDDRQVHWHDDVPVNELFARLTKWGLNTEEGFSYAHEWLEEPELIGLTDNMPQSLARLRELQQKQAETIDVSEILDKEFEEPDLGTITLRTFLKKLAAQVFIEDEGFSGKRPFGNSGWQHQLEWAMVRSGVIPGTIDKDDVITPIDFDKMIQEAINAL